MLKTLGYWAYAVQMQFYWTVAVTGSLFSGWWFFESDACLVLMILSILATIGDTYSRIFVEYRAIRRDSRSDGSFSKRTKNKWIRAQKFAPCRRFATGAAIRDIQYARKSYRDMGYRWWHVFPDEFYKKMWSISYWKQALFKH